MLILTRRPGESIYIGKDKDICITYLRLKGSQIAVGISAPIDIPIVRNELVDNVANLDESDEQE